MKAPYVCAIAARSLAAQTNSIQTLEMPDNKIMTIKIIEIITDSSERYQSEMCHHHHLLGRVEISIIVKFKLQFLCDRFFFDIHSYFSCSSSLSIESLLIFAPITIKLMSWLLQLPRQYCRIGNRYHILTREWIDVHSFFHRERTLHSAKSICLTNQFSLSQWSVAATCYAVHKSGFEDLNLPMPNAANEIQHRNQITKTGGASDHTSIGKWNGIRLINGEKFSFVGSQHLCIGHFNDGWLNWSITLEFWFNALL